MGNPALIEPESGHEASGNQKSIDPIDGIGMHRRSGRVRKFPGTEDRLTTSMKSVGETMSIGRTFKEALQKAIRSLEIGRFGLGSDIPVHNEPEVDVETIEAKLINPNSNRLFFLRAAFKNGLSIERIYELTHIDPWFLFHIKQICDMEDQIQACAKEGRGFQALDSDFLRQTKGDGFYDRTYKKWITGTTWKKELE